MNKNDNYNNKQIIYAVADILTVKIQCTKVPIVTDKHNVHES